MRFVSTRLVGGKYCETGEEEEEREEEEEKKKRENILTEIFYSLSCLRL